MLLSRQCMPQDQLRAVFVEKLAVHKGEVAGYLNEKWGDMEQQMDEQIQGIIADLKQKLRQQEAETSHYKNRARSKESKLKTFEEDNGRLLDMLRDSEKVLEERKSKLLKLDGKCRKYKEFLNSAISEQQELFKANKTKCDDAIAQMRTEETERQRSQEQEWKRAESARERLAQLLKSTIAEFKQKEHELNERIQFLRQEIVKRDTDLERERETAQVAQETNSNVRSIQDTLENFKTHIQNVWLKTAEVASHQDKHDDPEATQNITMLTQIINTLHDFSERGCFGNNFSNKPLEMNEHTVATVAAKLEPILNSQTEVKNNLALLSTDFRDYVDQIWTALENRQNVLEESIEQRQAENEQQILNLQNELEASQQDCVHQKQLVGKLETAVNQQESEIEELLGEVSELEEAQVDHLVQFDRLKRINEEYETLKEEFTVRASQASETEEELRLSRSLLDVAKKEHQSIEEELRKRLEEQYAAAQVAQADAVDAARRDASLRISEATAENEKRLGKAEEERQVLQADVEAARGQILNLTDVSSKNYERIEQLQQQLEATKPLDAQVRQDEIQKETEQCAQKEEQAKTIERLRSQLSSMAKKYNKLVENARSYDKAAHSVWQGLEQWTDNYSAIKELRAQLNQTQDAESSHIHPHFQPLVQLQLLSKAIEQYCEVQTAAAEKEKDEIPSGPVMLKADGQSISGSSPLTQTPLEHAYLGGVLDQIRRVMIRSPLISATPPVPPSVQNEQLRRRTAFPPKPILKLSSNLQTDQTEIDSPSQELLSRWHSAGSSVLRDVPPNRRLSDLATSNLSRSTYNRLVAGSRASIKATEEVGSARCPPPTTALGEHKPGEEQSTRRKTVLKQDREPSEKGQREGFCTPHSSSIDSGEFGDSEIEHEPHAPRKGMHLGLADEPPSSPIRVSQVSEDTGDH